jgi:hypothetical protein
MICENPDCSLAVQFILDLDESPSALQEITVKDIKDFDIYQCPQCSYLYFLANGKNQINTDPRRFTVLKQPVWKVIYDKSHLGKYTTVSLTDPALTNFRYLGLHYKAFVIEYRRPDGTLKTLKRLRRS